MLSDRERLARRSAEPFLLRLSRKLSRLAGVVTVMHTGAHPDDEQNAMLAAMRFARGWRTVVACSTRGEGGQNAIGAERGGALGVLRTREMEESARVIDADVAWLGHGPDDPVHDFGFSKSGEDTLARWGRTRILERLVRAYREYRPDIVIPTFLDVPGQHGHHRAMTWAAEEAIALAADPAAFPEQGLAPWSVAKFYLPAWSGGGATYDDEVPPPAATVTFRAPERDLATGAAYGEIGEWSRAFHASQGMGSWREPWRQEWPLHGRGLPPEGDLGEGLPRTLADLAPLAPAAGPALAAAQRHMDEARAAFPDAAGVSAAAIAARRLLTGLADLPDGVRHRVERKIQELDAVILEAEGCVPHAWIGPEHLREGAATALHLAFPTAAAADRAKPAVRIEGVSAGPAVRNGSHIAIALTVAAERPHLPAFPPRWDALSGAAEPAVTLMLEVGGMTVTGAFGLEEAPQVLPAHSITFDPETLIVPLRRPAPQTVTMRGGETAQLETPEGWTARQDGSRLTLTPPREPAPGLLDMAVLAAGRRAERVTEVHHAHIGRAALVEPAGLKVLALDLAVPAQARIAYLGAGGDRVAQWLARMGLMVAELDAERVAAGDFEGFTTVVAGVLALTKRPELAAAAPALRAFVEGGGNLVTLYHQSGKGWNVALTPRPVEIGSPSLRWRVTDPAAPVTVLEPAHPLLTGPNRIGADDWAGWHKERGLYFASRWAEAYRPLLALNDPGEAPLTGALITGEIGRGRHTHVSLSLHHQLDRLVPGAFRLMANLVQPVGD